MDVEEIIDKAIEQGFLYRRKRLHDRVEITFTKLLPSSVDEIRMREVHFTSIDANPANAAEQAYLGITRI